MAAGKDYSGTPLSQKLGAKPDAGVVVFFTTSRAELERRFPALKATLDPGDGLWVAWPKKAAKIEDDLTFEAVQEIGLANGLVDNKSCSIERSGFLSSPDDASYSRSNCARNPFAAMRTVCSTRFARVSGRFALVTHQRIALRDDGLKRFQFSRAATSASRPAASSGGSSSRSTASSAVHEPFTLATSIAAIPAGASSPSRSSRATRSLFDIDHVLRGLRGAKSCRLRRTSSRFTVLSIQPKQSASSTASS